MESEERPCPWEMYLFCWSYQRSKNSSNMFPIKLINAEVAMTEHFHINFDSTSEKRRMSEAKSATMRKAERGRGFYIFSGNYNAKRH